MSLSYMGNIQTATTILDIGLVWPAIWSGASLNVDSTANTASFAGFPAFPTILLNGVSSSFSDVYVSVTAGGGATRVDLGLDGTRVARLEGNRYQPIDIVHLSGLTTPAFQLSGSATFDWCCQDSWRPGTMTIYAMPAVAAVPEPQSYALFASGLGLIGVFARRRARQLGQSSFPT
jgi:hypothetical protein